MSDRLAVNPTIGLRDPAVPINRIERRSHLPALGSAWTIRLASPRSFDDPMEDFATWTSTVERSSDGYSNYSFGRHIPRLFISCWSRAQESDPLWRAYSYYKPNVNGRNEFPRAEGVQLRTTPAKLLRAAGGPLELARLWLAEVSYQTQEDIISLTAREVSRAKHDAFGTGSERVMSAVYKRGAFAHEQEVRLIYEGQTDDDRDSVTVEVDPNDVFDAIATDPRLTHAEHVEREDEFRALGYKGSVLRSDLYRPLYLQIAVGDLGMEDLGEI